MTLVFTIDWKKIPEKKKQGNFITLRITCIDQNGKLIYFNKIYEEWFGICTNDINAVINKMNFFFPGMKIRIERMITDDNTLYKKVLPYFRERLKTKRFDYENHPFYKVFIDSPAEDIGFFFNNYDIAYFQKSDWLVRIYIDLCTKYNTKNGFFYRWYNVDPNNPSLMDSFQMINGGDEPNWKIAAFDIETVPMSGDKNRIPNGLDPLDKIVMISIIKWDNNNRNNKKEYVLYLNPITEKLSLDNKSYMEYNSEKQLLNDFHFLIQDCHVITGYNINKFDIPCIFARLLWLGMYNILNQYSSSKIGDYLITTFQNKIVIDVYNYFQIFSNYDLSSFKLDNVAKIKLGLDEGKLPIDSVGIHTWYLKSRDITRELCLSTDNKYCSEILLSNRAKRFGTFLQYLEYCLRDSELVYRLFLKEMILGFLTARANFVAMDVVHAMHLGNSRFLLELFKTYGNLLHFFINMEFFTNDTDGSKYSSVFMKNSNTYQGALNYCLSEKYFENVAVLDFTSMYPISLLSSNLCYGTCDILTSDEYETILTNEEKNSLKAIPYRVHSDEDFTNKIVVDKEFFQYPFFDSEKDNFVIVINQNEKAFLPTLVEHFLVTREYHQRKWKETRNVIHYNTQLCIKILINSMYGVMASKDSPLAYIVIAMAIVTLARYQLLGSYHFVENLGYTVCYADTDSLMVHLWPDDDCNIVNTYLNLPYVNLKFEHRMDRLLILSKKRYIYDINGQIYSKGFQKKINDLVKFMSDKIIKSVMNLNGNFGENPSDGWILWVNTLLEALFMCYRDPKKYSITRKTKKLDEYISTTCAAVKMLQKYPEKEGGYIDYTYSRADVSTKEASKWIMDVDDCQYVNFEQLFISQKKILITLLNIGYWKLPNPQIPCDMILNTIRWKFFVHAELKNYFTKKKKIMILVEKGTKYTFKINDCYLTNTTRKKSVVVKKRKEIDVIDEYKQNNKKRF